MRLSRHEQGFAADLKALASQVHPVFMAPPLAGSVFGALLYDGRVSLILGFLHIGAVFFGLYTAHVKDGYIDFYVRDEDDDHPLTCEGCKFALAGSTVAFFLFTAGIGLFVDIYAVLLTLPGWMIGYLHAPQFDMNPVTATAAYPAGIGLAVAGGNYVQSGFVSVEAAWYGVVFFVILSGVKIIDDSEDYKYDRSISKRTVAVAVGPKWARRTAYGVIGAGLLGVTGLVAFDIFPETAILGVIAFAAVGWAAEGVEPKFATMMFIRGSYIFLALLFVSAVFSGEIDIAKIGVITGFLGAVVVSRFYEDEKATEIVIKSAYAIIGLLVAASYFF